MLTGSKFFPYRVDPFSERDKIILTVTSPDRVSIPLNSDALYTILHVYVTTAVQDLISQRDIFVLSTCIMRKFFYSNITFINLAFLKEHMPGIHGREWKRNCGIL